MAIIDYTSTIGAVFQGVAQNSIGSEPLTLFILMIIMAAVMMGFSIELDLIMGIEMPIAIVGYILYPVGIFSYIVGFILAYLAFLFAKRVILNT